MKKKLLAMLLGLAMAASLTACGKGQTQPSPDAAVEDGSGEEVKKDYHFAIIVKSFQATYWQAAVKGVDEARKELGVTANCNGPANETDIADQIQMINNAIEQKPDGIAIAACDTKSVLDSLQKAKDAGIPVVCFDTGVESAPDGAVVATVATDNLAAGACAAENLYPVIRSQIKASTADAKVRIGEVNQDATALNIQQRGLGFIARMIELAAEDGKKVAVVGNEFYVNAVEGASPQEEAEVLIEIAVPAQTTVDLSTTEAQKIMSKKDTIAIFGSNQTTAEGIIGANQTLNVLSTDPAQGIVAVGFDAGTPQKEAIAGGYFLGAVTQSPLKMGYECVQALYAACSGEAVEDVPMQGYWYDANNMDSEEIAPNLYN